jgi:hypothetical protein
MNRNVKLELSLDKYELPQSLAASLDIEELERRLELSEMEMDMAYSEAEYEAALAAAPWDPPPHPLSTATVGAPKKTW